MFYLVSKIQWISFTKWEWVTQKHFINTWCFWYDHYLLSLYIKITFFIIPNLSQNGLTCSTYLSPYSGFSSSTELMGVEYIVYLNRLHKENSSGSDIKSVVTQQLIHRFQSNFLTVVVEMGCSLVWIIRRNTIVLKNVSSHSNLKFEIAYWIRKFRWRSPEKSSFSKP